MAFLRLDRLYLLAGEGQHLKVFDQHKSQLLYTKQIFSSEAIHGIACSVISRLSRSGILLIWGGRSLCVLSIEASLDPDGGYYVDVHFLQAERTLPDRILDGCFQGLPDDVEVDESHELAVKSAENTTKSPEIEVGDFNTNRSIALITAHNELYLSESFSTGSPDLGVLMLSHRIIAGPRSILYSAHVLWPTPERVTIAAGTVLGEVIFWSLPCLESDSFDVHYNFKGHEGSVFGVRISESTNDFAPQPILASCSDDRTIRLWDISDETPDERSNSASHFHETPTNHEREQKCLATVMGHVSRIWGLRFLGKRGHSHELLSHGEDGTAQVWRMSLKRDDDQSRIIASRRHYMLEHLETYSYHSGKNLWAVSVHIERGITSIATGGADGRIASYQRQAYGQEIYNETSSHSFTFNEASTSAKDQDPLPMPPRRRIFNALRGRWKLSRVLKSSIPSWPSGMAISEQRFLCW